MKHLKLSDASYQSFLHSFKLMLSRWPRDPDGCANANVTVVDVVVDVAVDDVVDDVVDADVDVDAEVDIVAHVDVDVDVDAEMSGKKPPQRIFNYDSITFTPSFRHPTPPSVLRRRE